MLVIGGTMVTVASILIMPMLSPVFKKKPSITPTVNECTKQHPNLKKDWAETVDDNPYKLCEVGDIISVKSIVYEDLGFYPFGKMHYAKGVYANDVSRYCSYQHPITLLGSSKIKIEFEGKGGIESFTLNSYSCVYRGDNLNKVGF